MIQRITSHYGQTLFYLTLLVLLYIISTRNYDKEGTTVTVKRLDNPIHLKDLHDLQITPVFNTNPDALLVPMVDLIKYEESSVRDITGAYYLEFDNDRVTSISPWDTFIRKYPETLRERFPAAEKYRMDKSPLKQLEYGKVVGIDDTKQITYETEPGQESLETTPVEVGYINEIMEVVSPYLKKYFNDQIPNSLCFSCKQLNDPAEGSIGIWSRSGIFHQDAITDAQTLRRPYTSSTSQYKSKDIRMIIIDTSEVDEDSLTEFATKINGKAASQETLDDTVDDRVRLRGVSTTSIVDIIKIKPSGKSIVGILFDNSIIFHSTPRTSLSMIEFFLKNTGTRTIYQLGFNSGFPGPVSKASKKHKKRSKGKDKKSKDKKSKDKKSKDKKSKDKKNKDKKNNKSRRKKKSFKFVFE
jgi:hypothetical protein